MVFTNVKNVIYFMKMRNGQRSAKNGVSSTSLVILRSQDTPLLILNYLSHRYISTNSPLYIDISEITLLGLLNHDGNN